MTVNEFTFDPLHKGAEVYDPNTWRHYCHVKDFARIIFSVMKKKINLTRSAIVGSRNNYREKDIVELISNKITRKQKLFLNQGTLIRNYKVDF